jgi:hypothetical protein
MSQKGSFSLQQDNHQKFPCNSSYFVLNLCLTIYDAFPVFSADLLNTFPIKINARIKIIGKPQISIAGNIKIVAPGFQFTNQNQLEYLSKNGLSIRVDENNLLQRKQVI